MTSKNNIEQLFKAHYGQMQRMAAALLHDDDLSRDIVYDVFASLLDAPSDTQITGGYLLRAVRNRCLNHIRNCEIHDRIAGLDEVIFQLNTFEQINISRNGDTLTVD